MSFSSNYPRKQPQFPNNPMHDLPLFQIPALAGESRVVYFVTLKRSETFVIFVAGSLRLCPRILLSVWIYLLKTHPRSLRTSARSAIHASRCISTSRRAACTVLVVNPVSADIPQRGPRGLWPNLAVNFWLPAMIVMASRYISLPGFVVCFMAPSLVIMQVRPDLFRLVLFSNHCRFATRYRQNRP